MTLILLLAISLGIAWLWNRLFRPVPWLMTALLLAIVIAYEAPALFTSRVDFPAPLAYSAQPWQATGRPPIRANTGIVFTQLGPWTENARNAILAGEWPLWNRYSGCGMPLAANQQTAIYHPFTLAGLLLPIGKLFTLSAALRLFSCLFFTFVLFRNWASDGAALFGAAAYTFCTFNIVWLLFPHALATTALPMALAGAQELARERRLRAFFLLTLGLALIALAGQPETAFWCWLVAAAWCVYLRTRIVLSAAAFILAAMLTAFFWLPTVSLMPRLSRFGLMSNPLTNPPNHHLGIEWLTPLVAPNIHGTPQAGTYTPPTHRHPAVIDDYGEIASGYAGLATLVLAFAAIPLIRRRPTAFFLGLMLCAVLTFGEAPLWRDAVRWIPLAGITMHQRLRVFWALGACGAAVVALDRWAKWKALPPLLTAITLIDLLAVTWRYNPISRARDMYPVTNAIRVMRAEPPYRIAALGWSFIPDTPGAYGLEDVKTTDPIASPQSMRIVRGYLHAVPNDYDQVFGDVSEPFLDFLNIRYVYVPPEMWITDPRFALRHLGHDGAVFENLRVLPRYQLVRRFLMDPSFDRAIPKMNALRDFSRDALVTHVPPQVERRAPQLLVEDAEGFHASAGGSVRVLEYTANRTVLDVDSRGWSLLTTSDADWPGWRAYWNGKREPAVTVNDAFLGVFVPPGKGTLELRYRPDAFIDGLRISGAGTLIALVLLALRLRRGR